MKLTKKIESEIWKIYDSWLYSYLNGDVKTYKKYLDKDYHFIGSTENEEFLSKKETADFFKKTADQLAGKCDLRNETKIIEKFEGLILVTHLFDAWFKNGDDYAYYGRFRFTNALKNNKDGWHFIYQHFSTPDSKTAEGETIGFDRVNEENRALREAINRRTFELEQKNRELKVETALQRIRAEAVAMKTSSEVLDIVVTMRNEFIKLGHEAHYFWHMMWLPKTYEKAMTSADGTKIGFVMKLPKHMHGDIPQLAQWEKSKKPTVVYSMNVDEAIDYVDKMVSLGDFKNIDPQAPTHDDIKQIGGLTFVMARTSHGEIGYSLPGIVKNPPKEDLDIVVKFASAFDLAHQRFLDLQKAEKQARETQVELSLERIRSRVTAMQKSSDLFDIVVTMRNEFLSLGHEADYFWHMKWTKDNYEMSMTAEDGSRLGMVITVPKFVHEDIKTLHKWEKSNSPYFVLALNGEDAWDYIDNMNTHGKYKQVDPHAPSKEDIEHIGGLTFIIARTTHGEIGFSLAGEIKNPPKTSIKTLLRFAKVFDLAYKRFEDLQKAEAQARETQIELALEKVRSRTMAMQHSDELADASYLLDCQIRALGIKTRGCAFNIYGENDSTEWFSSEMGTMPTYKTPRENIFLRNYEEGQKGKAMYIKTFSGEACAAHYDYLCTLPVMGEALKDFKKSGGTFPTQQIDHVTYFKYGYLLFITLEPVPEAHDIFKRFAKVFEQTYTRFLDLQKAEAQAREAQIETALERVRSRSMAMHKSEELLEVINVVSEQLQLLNIKFNNVSFGINDENKDLEFWMSSPTWKNPFKLYIPYLDNPMLNRVLEARKNNKDFFSDTLTKKENNIWHKHVFKHSDTNVFDNETEKKVYSSPGYARSTVLMTNIFLTIGNYIPKSYSKEENEIFIRFAKVFEQSYTRFLDLQKAEAQTRKAQIEASLERVRAKAMAMQNSDELDVVLSVLCEQFDVLGIVPMSTHMTVLDFENNTFTFRETGKFGNRSFGEQTVALDAMDNWKETVDKWKADKATAINKLHFPKEQLPKVWEVFHESFASMPKSSRITPKDYPDGIYHTAGKHPFGYIGMNQTRPATEEEEQIVIKFANEFGMAYQRFLDLQKAEAQAREAQIEAALEKVRSRSLAMQKPDELQEVVATIAEKLQELGVIYDAGGVILCTYFPDSKDMLHWISADDFSSSGRYLLPYFDNQILSEAWDSKLRGDAYFSKEFSKKVKNHFFEYAFEHSDYKHFPEDYKQHVLKAEKHALSGAWSKNSAIIIPTLTGLVPSESDAEIMQRFAKVFEQAYIRFMDLQKAEERARETQIDIALERVRSRSMAMHQSDELSEAAEILYQEFYKLGVTPFSCGYLINDDKNESWKVWMTDANDETFKNFWTLPYNADHHLQSRFKSWKSKEAFHSSVLKGDENIAHHKVIAKYAPWKQESMGELPKMLVLSSAHFTHGHLLIVTGELLTPEVESILTRFATVFDQTYIRFLDLKKAEHQALLIKEEKERLEVTINDLRATQKQLIQSEKMASLGELTAGIAHEIQNPLNFVNNFSEVSKELLEEMLEEIENGDMVEVKSIMNDVTQNLEKINHHGKRADGIVKGMLQHSRASGSKKEPTDINALADEYLRLAYHGLRAKDKSFNATLETDYDTTIGLITLIPQDMGRVILNLITNAFYAVNEKLVAAKASNVSSYKPTVTVSTKKAKDQVIISVKDNGNGIPDEVVKKIFQPFFTTKPTGQGTGLGLSMSYDIITKGHGGTLQVETVEGEGTTFIINLSIND